MKQLPYDETNQCVQCGYCLPACPTYSTIGTETHSPRGRINLVKLAAEERITLEELKGPIDLCLGCRACETACPSGVEYGKILEETRAVLHDHQQQKTSRTSKWMQNLLFANVIPNSKKLQAATDMIWMYQATGLRKMAAATKVIKIVPEHLAAFEEVLPDVTSPTIRRNRPAFFKPVAGSKLKGRIAFFTGCVMDAIFERINRLPMQADWKRRTALLNTISKHLKKLMRISS